MKWIAYFFVCIFLLCSCKAKYEELLIKYNRVQQKKKEIVKERKETDKLIRESNDSLKVFIPKHAFWQKYFNESNEILGYKKEFFSKKLSLYQNNNPAK